MYQSQIHIKIEINSNSQSQIQSLSFKKKIKKRLDAMNDQRYKVATGLQGIAPLNKGGQHEAWGNFFPIMVIIQLKT